MTAQTVTIEATIHAPIDDVWRAYTTPEGITQWNFASEDWCCPHAEVDLRPGGTHTARMEAKDGSFGFDFGGVYETVEPGRAITLVLGDGRRSRTTFATVDGRTVVRTTFDAEGQNPVEMQRSGWQAILDNFKAYAERTHG